MSGQHTSWTDLPLTEHGEEQARSLAPLLSGRAFALALTSPLGRAIRTAELAGITGAVPDPELHEWDYGAYEGVTTVDIHRTRPHWYLWTDDGCRRALPDTRASPGRGRRPRRPGPEAGGRLAGDGDVVLVAHAHFLRVLTARRLGLPAADGRLFQLATGTVSRLSTEHDRPVIAEWNTRP